MKRLKKEFSRVVAIVLALVMVLSTGGQATYAAPVAPAAPAAEKVEAPAEEAEAPAEEAAVEETEVAAPGAPAAPQNEVEEDSPITDDDLDSIMNIFRNRNRRK